jgi:hypothetical protein
LQNEFGREFPLFEVEATTVEPIFQRLYSFIFDMEPGYSANEMDRPVPVAIFVVNFDKVWGITFNTIFLSFLTILAASSLYSASFIQILDCRKHGPSYQCRSRDEKDVAIFLPFCRKHRMPLIV